MTKHFFKLSITLVLFFVAGPLFAQVHLFPLEYDPVLAGNKVVDRSGLRIQAVSKDTLPIPFFDDFSSFFSQVKLIKENVGETVEITTIGLHNLSDREKIISFGIDHLEMPVDCTWYVKVIDKFSFQLYRDNDLTDAVTGTSPKTYTPVFRSWINPVNIPYHHIPDTLKWLNEGNVYVNNRFCINPPSFNAATFDGLKIDGTPYSTNRNDIGKTDHMTSAPINLEGLTEDSLVYLTFFWQKNGLGESPDKPDYIRLEFKTNDDKWVPVWTQFANDIANNHTDTFKLEFIKIPAEYLYKGFQFKFYSYGRMAGSYDTWNIDYIYLDKKRAVSHTADMSVTSVGGILKNYSSMPYDVFFQDPDTHINLEQDSCAIEYQLSNLNIFQLTTDVIRTFTDNYGYSQSKLIERTLKYPKFYNGISLVGKNEIIDENKPKIFRQRIFVKTLDSAFFKSNDAFTGQTVLHDYYAYDDGTPEYYIGGNVPSSYVNEFNIIQQDTLTDIDLYFTLSRGPNMTGRAITLIVLDQNKNIIKSQIVKINYPNGNTPFRYRLDTAVVLPPGKFFVGYKQGFSDFLTLGYDRNAKYGDKLHIYAFSRWEEFDSTRFDYITGAAMIRAVFGKGEIISAVQNPVQSEELESISIYPNPSEGIIYISGKAEKINILDISGKPLLYFDYKSTGKDVNLEADLSSLPNGIYLLQVINGQSVKMEKIVISR